ncbi:MAG: hypothetical protein LBT74_09135 [Acidobacteriota bacterium]|jgi:hypothetical protein|nr:hypothetical protein [Acidobacteriota bacterium]
MNYYNYFTEVEEHFVRRRGKHLLVSPMDWHLIASWRDAGVPLHVALRGIDIAMDGYHARQGGGAGRVNSLCYCHDAVMEAYSGHLESHIGESVAVPGDGAGATADADAPGEGGGGEFGKDAILGFLFEKTNEIKTLVAKLYTCGAPEDIERVLVRLDEVAGALEAGGKPDTEALERDLRILDELLVGGLRAEVPAQEAEEWAQEAKKDKLLKVYKRVLPKEEYEKRLEDFYRDKVREKFQVGQLSLFRI